MKTTRSEMKKQKLMTKDQMIDKMRKMNAKHNDNMESRKNALKTLMGGIPVVNKVFVLVPVEDLHIDESYQRTVQNHVRTIAEEWDDMKCDPLKINYREDGNLYVWDGQHRLVALKIMGIDYVLCVITVGLTQKQEAALFGCQGNGIKKPNPYDIYRANVCSGQEIDSAIKSMCDKYGLSVDKNNKKAGNLTCLTLARKIFEKGYEDREYFEWVLDLLHKVKWNELAQSHCHRIINSLYEIRKNSSEDIDFVQRKLVLYLQKNTPDELLINATIKYPQFKDESKKIKLYLMDVIDCGEPNNNIIDNWDKVTA
ncbi:hypothetical protein C804_00001 [Lachnospiraceae bacterium A4]|nr:hypothetical protein C804_00001 [Lachnospiraceae bacterium A4]